MIGQVLDRLDQEIERVKESLKNCFFVEVGRIYKNRKGVDTYVSEAVGNPYYSLLGLTDRDVEDEAEFSYFHCEELDENDQVIGRNRVNIYGCSKYGYNKNLVL